MTEPHKHPEIGRSTRRCDYSLIPLDGARVTEQQRERILALCERLRLGRIHLIDALREALRSREALEAAHSEAARTIIGYESETDDVPRGRARAFYAPEYLAQLDQDTEVFLENNRPAIAEAFAAIERALRESGPPNAPGSAH